MNTPEMKSRPTYGSSRGTTQQQSESCDVQFLDDTADYLVRYARQKPEMAALWCLGIGFVLGWKLKPW